jgi:hypothetical protein
MTIIDKMNKIFELIKEIKDENDAVGSLLLVNFKSAVDTIEAANNKTELDVSEKLELLTKLLGYDLEQLVTHILEKDYINNQNGDFVNSKEADKATIDFIVGNTASINNTKDAGVDDYEKFLADSNLKENMEFLKQEI